MSLSSGPRPRPPIETLRARASARVIGVFIKGMSDTEKKAEELEARNSLDPKVNTERWYKWKDENGVRPPGRDVLEIWRIPATGRFAKKPDTQDLAERYSLKTGKDLPHERNRE